MRTTCDLHYPLWRPEDRAPITLAQVGRLPSGERYATRCLDLDLGRRGEHFRQAALRRREEMKRRRP
jgi:hypothetical protein